MVKKIKSKPDTLLSKHSSEQINAINIYSYVDYRAYLVATYKQLKETSMIFSDRYFARLAKVGSSSYLRMVINGSRNLTSASAAKFARGLRLGRKETKYFETMVLFSQADSEDDRDRLMADLLKMRPKARAEAICTDQLEYVSDSLFVIIREMSVLPHFKADPHWIAGKLYRQVTPMQVRHALDLLERLKLLGRDANGSLCHTHQALESPRDADAVEFLNYHRQILSESKEVLVTAPYDQWDVSSKTIAISSSVLPKVMNLMRGFQDELDALLQESSKDFEEVFQINMQLFPVTQSKRQHKD